LRLIDFVDHSTLGLRVIKKKKKPGCRSRKKKKVTCRRRSVVRRRRGLHLGRGRELSFLLPFLSRFDDFKFGGVKVVPRRNSSRKCFLCKWSGFRFLV